MRFKVALFFLIAQNIQKPENPRTYVNRYARYTKYIVLLKITFF